MSPLEEEHFSSDCEFFDGMDDRIRYRCEWELFHKVRMGKPASMRIFKKYPLARLRFMRMREPPPLYFSSERENS